MFGPISLFFLFFGPSAETLILKLAQDWGRYVTRHTSFVALSDKSSSCIFNPILSHPRQSRKSSVDRTMLRIDYSETKHTLISFNMTQMEINQGSNTRNMQYTLDPHLLQMFGTQKTSPHGCQNLSTSAILLLCVSPAFIQIWYERDIVSVSSEK